jgi:hypothetical protein
MTRFEREVQARWNRDVPSAQAEALFAAARTIGRQIGCLDEAPSTFRFSRWTKAVAENTNARNVFTGDVDGDQLVDVIVDALPTITVLVGDGAGSFRTRVDTGISGTVMAAADLNADGRTDLVVSDQDEPALRLLISARAGSVTFTETRIALDAPPKSVAVGDLTGDGRVDIVVGNDRLTTATLIAGAGRGRFKAPQAIDTGYTPTYVSLADVTGDGRLDLVYLYYSYLFIARGTGAGLPEPWQYLRGGISNFRLADLDGDHLPELVAWQSGRVDVYRFEGSGLALGSTVVSGRVANLYVADLNEDDRPDLVIFESERSYKIVQGNGDGTFGVREALSTRPSSGAVSMADLNRDGRVDLLIATENRTPPVFWMGTAGVTVLLNKPAVFVGSPNDETSIAIGTVTAITWDHELPSGTAFRIDVSRDGGASWTTIAPRATTGRFAWTVTGPATRQARFRVTSLGSPAASDVNNADVSIGVPSITLNAPQAGENWGIGTERRIAFEHNLGTSERVHVDLSRDDGRTWTRLESDVPLNGTTSAQFATVTSGLETTTARVRVTSVRDPKLNVVSGAFRIAAPFVQLVAPSSGNNYPLCTVMPITWRHNLGTLERMNVEVSYDGGAAWRPVVMDFANLGASRTTVWHWVGGPETQTGMVRVTWTKDGRLTAVVAKLLLGRNEGYDCDDD